MCLEQQIMQTQCHSDAYYSCLCHILFEGWHVHSWHCCMWSSTHTCCLLVECFLAGFPCFFLWCFYSRWHSCYPVLGQSAWLVSLLSTFLAKEKVLLVNIIFFVKCSEVHIFRRPEEVSLTVMFTCGLVDGPCDKSRLVVDFIRSVKMFPSRIRRLFDALCLTTRISKIQSSSSKQSSWIYSLVLVQHGDVPGSSSSSLLLVYFSVTLHHEYIAKTV